MQAQLISQLNEILMREIGSARKIELLCDTVRDGIQAHRGSIFISSGEELFSIKQDGESMLSLPTDKGVAGAVFNTKKAIILNDAKESNLVLSLTDYEIENLMAVPIINVNTSRICGVVEFFNRAGGFHEEQRQVTAFAATHFANFIERIAEKCC